MKSTLPRTQVFPGGLIAAFSLTLTAAGCGSILTTQQVLHASGGGTVALEEIVDWSFEASHPAPLDPKIVARILQGVQVGSGGLAQVYSQQEIDFLAPLLAHALSKARPEHIVVFRLTGDEALRGGISGGTLYVKGPAVYLTPLSSRSSPASSSFFGTSTHSLAPADAHALAFEPRTVARTQKATADVGLGRPYLLSFVIDHMALTRIPVSDSTQKPSPTPPPSATLPSKAVPAPIDAPVRPVPAPPSPAKSAATTPPATTVTSPAPTASSQKTPGAKSAGSSVKPATKSASKKAGARAKPAKTPAKPAPAGATEHRAILEVLKKTPAMDPGSSTK